MEEVTDPFNLPKQDKKESTPTPKQIDYQQVIQRLAEIEDEIKSRGIEELLEEKEALRKVIKDSMVAACTEVEYDEASNYEAVIVPRTKDVWDLPVLKTMLSKSQQKRYIVEAVDEVAVKTGTKTGDLSRGAMEVKGAVKKVQTALALYVREREMEE